MASVGSSRSCDYTPPELLRNLGDRPRVGTLASSGVWSQAIFISLSKCGTTRLRQAYAGQKTSHLLPGRAFLASGRPPDYTPGDVGYPTDLGHNFVLAHAGCNNSKSDYLAAETHLGTRQERNQVHGEELTARFAAAEIISDMPASVRIARWAYEQTEQAGGQVWVTKDMLRHLGPEWRLLLGV